MGKVIVVTSGKGGVGKTTSTAALGAALARAGEKVVVVDFDVGLRNLDLVMGASTTSSTSCRASSSCPRR
jgi:septum site-determining protein MinD